MRIFFLILPFLAGCFSQKQREPASLPPVSSSVSMPVRLVCSAPATSQGIFQFSGDGDDLVAEFHGAGEATIKGKASVLLREQGDESLFEGVIDVAGTRSADARVYKLKAKVRGEDWDLELRREGDSSLWRTINGKPRSYHSKCSEPQ